MEGCPRRGGEEWAGLDEAVRTVTKEMFGLKRMEDFAGCFFCGVPQALCGRWVADDGDGRRFRQVKGGRCQYKGTLVKMYLGLMMGYRAEATEVMEAMMREDGVDGEDTSRWYVWLGRMIEWGGIQASKMCRVCVYLGRLE